MEHNAGEASKIVCPMDHCPPPIAVEVTFGSPSQRCQGAGICMLTTTHHSHLHSSCPYVRAWLGQALAGTLYLSFEGDTFSEGVLPGHLTTRRFEVTESYSLPAPIASALGLVSYEIKPGHYTVIRAGLSRIIIF